MTAVLKGSLRKLFIPVHLGGAGGFACQRGIARVLRQLARPSFEQAKPPAPPTRLTVTRANALIPKVQHAGTNLCGIGMASCGGMVFRLEFGHFGVKIARAKRMRECGTRASRRPNLCLSVFIRGQKSFALLALRCHPAKQLAD